MQRENSLKTINKFETPLKAAAGLSTHDGPLNEETAANMLERMFIQEHGLTGIHWDNDAGLFFFELIGCYSMLFRSFLIEIGFLRTNFQTDVCI